MCILFLPGGLGLPVIADPFEEGRNALIHVEAVEIGSSNLLGEVGAFLPQDVEIGLALAPLASPSLIDSATLRQILSVSHF